MPSPWDQPAPHSQSKVQFAGLSPPAEVDSRILRSPGPDGHCATENVQHAEQCPISTEIVSISLQSYHSSRPIQSAIVVLFCAFGLLTHVYQIHRSSAAVQMICGLGPTVSTWNTLPCHSLQTTLANSSLVCRSRIAQESYGAQLRSMRVRTHKHATPSQRFVHHNARLVMQSAVQCAFVGS